MLRTLDTNICSYILRKRPESLIQRFSTLQVGDVWISVIVAAELRFGAEKLGSDALTAVIEGWLAAFEVRPWPIEASSYYAKVRQLLNSQGQPIGNMDLMIAAHALAEDSVVITNNAREFHRVPGLAVEEWRLS